MKKKPSDSSRGGAREGAGRKPTGKKTVNLTVSISPEAKANLEAKSDATGKSQSAIVDAWAKKLKP